MHSDLTHQNRRPHDLSCRKTTVITGASRGIGAATARHITAQGANIVLAARNTDAIAALADELGATALAIPCDVSDWQQVSNPISRTVSHFGSLDVLINNAGVIDPISRLEDSDPAAWGNVTDINIKGVYHGPRAAIPVMAAQAGPWHHTQHFIRGGHQRAGTLEPLLFHQGGGAVAHPLCRQGMPRARLRVIA